MLKISILTDDGGGNDDGGGGGCLPRVDVRDSDTSITVSRRWPGWGRCGLWGDSLRNVYLIENH